MSKELFKVSHLERIRLEAYLSDAAEDLADARAHLERAKRTLKEFGRGLPSGSHIASGAREIRVGTRGALEELRAVQDKIVVFDLGKFDAWDE